MDSSIHPPADAHALNPLLQRWLMGPLILKENHEHYRYSNEPFYSRSRFSNVSKFWIHFRRSFQYVSYK